jgi:hypothetical protein
MVLAAAALLAQKPRPDEAEVVRTFEGNFPSKARGPMAWRDQTPAPKVFSEAMRAGCLRQFF